MPVNSQLLPSLLLFFMFSSSCRPDVTVVISTPPPCEGYNFDYRLEDISSSTATCTEGNFDHAIGVLAAKWFDFLHKGAMEVSLDTLLIEGERQASELLAIYNPVSGYDQYYAEAVLGLLSPFTQRTDVSYRVTVVDHPKRPNLINACVMADGHILVTSSLIDLDEEKPGCLAFALAHELSHVELLSGDMDIARNKAIVDGLPFWAAPYIIGGADLLTQSFNRTIESCSDRWALWIMNEAGYDPNGAIELFEVFEELEGGANQMNLLDLLTKRHPYSTSRMACVNDEIRRAHYYLKDCNGETADVDMTKSN